MDDATVADRLTLVSEIPGAHGGAPHFLDEPVWIKAGQRYWFDYENSTLVVEDPTTGTVTYAGKYKSGPDAIR